MLASSPPVPVVSQLSTFSTGPGVTWTGSWGGGAATLLTRVCSSLVTILSSKQREILSQSPPSSHLIVVGQL